jgi:uncharacterized oligopeptide transporter (OPT) family protein
MPVAVGIYLPLSLGVHIFLGGLVKYFVNRAKGKGSEVSPTDPGTLGAAGLIAGEALMGIIFAALIVMGTVPSIGFSSNLLGILLVVAVMAWLFRTGTKKA